MVMQRVLTTGEGAFHVHIHGHTGTPGPSYVDKREIRPLIKSIRYAAPEAIHGSIILSSDRGFAEALLPGSSEFHPVKGITVVGFPTTLLARPEATSRHEEHFSRQSFLGADEAEKISAYRIGIIGLGGGGSHVAQQLAHVGFAIFSLFDMDVVEMSNLNRLIGGTQADARAGVPKVDVVARLIMGVNPRAKVEKLKSRWQDVSGDLRACDILFGCVDSYAERRDIEIAARRHLIPLVDVGLDVHQSGDEPPRMAGQVILSMPGYPCMSCLGFLTPTNIAREAEKYGAAGPRPQVVWANGVLASNAVGIVVDLITDWTRSVRGPIYLSYDSNTGEIHSHKRLQYLGEQNCSHFPLSNLGQPTFKRL